MELNGDYLSHIPTAVPAGKILVHNDIWPPVRRIGTKRFRIWFATPSDRFEVPMRMGTGVARALSHDTRRGLQSGLDGCHRSSSP